MPFDLTERQIKLLQAVIMEYIETSEPVGSQTIVERYKMSCSAATIRNEMADLMERGFLLMAHTSSGRKPTALAYKFYIQELLEEEELSVLQEVAIKQRLWPLRFELEKLLKQVSLVLSDATHEIGFATSNDNFLVYSGVANILDQSEFWNIETAKAALGIIDRYSIINDLLTKHSMGQQDVNIIMGEEINIEGLNETAFVFGKYNNKKNHGFVGILGPCRMRYSKIIPTVRYVRNLTQELLSGW